MSEPDAIHLTKNRIVAVDITRIIAAICVMGHHFLDPLKSEGALYQNGVITFYRFGSSAIFFVLAGYFACRNITWKKALNNAWWSFAPFMLWNGIAILYMMLEYPVVWDYMCAQGITWYSVFGVNYFFTADLAILPGLPPDMVGGAIPWNAPLWFMRDLIFLFLLSPILYRFARYIFPVLLVMSVSPVFCRCFSHNLGVTLSLYSILMFTGGCFMRTLAKETQKKILHYTCPWMVLVIIGFTVVPYYFNIQGGGVSLPSSIMSLFSFCLTYWTARWLELRFPCIIPLMLTLAPVTFLTFASHAIVLPLLPAGWWSFFYPFAFFAVMTVLFLAMKRWTPWAIHLVAHYKLRPDDLNPELKLKKGEIPKSEAEFMENPR